MDKYKELELRNILREKELKARGVLADFVICVASGQERSDEELVILPAIAKILLE